jgi:hypothetical protein
MSVVKSLFKSFTPVNPLNAFEELLEASPYEYSRPSNSRLHFECAGKQGDYTVMLEWNEQAAIIKSLLIIEATKSVSDEILNKAIATANESTWHGFFSLDGVGHTVFKSLIKMESLTEEDSVYQLEDSIDEAIKEADRFSVSLALSKNQEMDLFQSGDITLENMTLMFADVKGHA